MYILFVIFESVQFGRITIFVHVFACVAHSSLISLWPIITLIYESLYLQLTMYISIRLNK